MATYISPAETAKLVRKALADAFPGVKFGVRSKTYSGGASIRVEWIDGPTTGQVEAVAKRFEGATFDGMIDLKSYHTSILNGEEVRFGADFVNCQRGYTAAFAQRAADKVCRMYGLESFAVKDTKYGADWSDAYRVRVNEWGNDTLQDLIYRELAKRAAVTVQAVAH